MAAIQVYASFPCAVAPAGADLDLAPTNWRWVHCLSLPLDTLKARQFSQRPYKWIRYAIGVVVGAEGDLSSSPDLPDIVDYDIGHLPSESATLYYHTSDEERRRMCPIDPDLERTESFTSSIATTRLAHFIDDVKERDGSSCVMTGLDEKLCDAAHLLAQTKGDTYISTYTQRRSRSTAGDDIVQDINSVRNGLFINGFSHKGLGKHLAFLPTPNFAMDTADLDPNAPPEGRRYTTHLFKPDIPFFLGGRNAPPSGSPIRISDTPQWPPAILFDAVYAGAVLQHFGTETLKEDVTAAWKETFLSSMTEEEKAIADGRAAAAKMRAYERKAQEGPDNFDILMAMPYISVPRDKLKILIREAKVKAEAEEHERMEEKVNTWMEQIADE
ncbi:hypothetical protein D9615_008142 [Tricholomella constricta]|uniref:HNH nuclease domain-containing protein n=1 Tax=Tricholomella constricta TaxID=117010 RepID=A0A8H5GVH2_9AGAR|nr:hypothetical protein D9615_008142 [Tricholomella constricta]